MLKNYFSLWTWRAIAWLIESVSPVSGKESNEEDAER